MLGLWLSCGLNGTAQVTAIKAGRLIDVETEAVRRDQVILVRDNKIVAVGKDLAIPAGAKVIDLSKMTVLPGLIGYRISACCRRCSS
jgi:imidazolonepropionase-like amidohydrolase